MPNYKVLYIEDYAPASITLDFILKDIGHDPTGVETGRQAIDLVRQHHYDIILIDVKLPDMPGHEVAQEIRNLPNYSEDKTVLVGHSADIDHISAEDVKKFDFAENKDFEPATIQNSIRRWSRKLK